MKLKGVCKFLACETKVSKKTNNEYISCALLCGVDTFNCLSEIAFREIAFGQNLDVDFEFNTKYNNLKIIGFKKI